MEIGVINSSQRFVDPENGVTSNRSDSLKRMGSTTSTEENDLLNPRSPKNPKTALQQQGSGKTPLLSLSTGPQMLSFSNPGSDASSLSKNGGFTYQYQNPPYAYTVDTGYGSGVHVPVGAPFTPSQWVELQHQALMYKYIQANVTVPSNLLLGLKRSVSPYGFSGFPSGSYSYTPNGWVGSFHLGFPGNTDPEPGRCRRTDGKKWRCSKDAVPDQKYCERHLNRGRHRSRKLVEGRAGQVVAGPNAGMGPAACSTSATPVISSSGVPRCAGPSQCRFEGTQQPHAADITPSTDANFNRVSDHQGLAMLSPTTDLNPKDSIFSISKQHIATEESSQSDFGLVSSDSLLNPSLKGCSYTNSTICNPILQFNDSESYYQYPLPHFSEGGWSKDQLDRATWPEELKQEWTRLSMSIHKSSDFSPTSSSSPQEKMTLSSLSLSHEHDPVRMTPLSPSQKEMNWVPISLDNLTGGPLGEVLNSTTNSSNVGPFKNLSAGIGSSPTGVLQKMSSSTGSSPRGESRKIDRSGGPGDGMFSPNLSTSLFFPSL